MLMVPAPRYPVVMPAHPRVIQYRNSIDLRSDTKPAMQWREWAGVYIAVVDIDAGDASHVPTLHGNDWNWESASLTRAM